MTATIELEDGRYKFRFEVEFDAADGEPTPERMTLRDVTKDGEIVTDPDWCDLLVNLRYHKEPLEDRIYDACVKAMRRNE